MKKIQCQPTVSTIKPPANGPKILAIPQAALFKPKISLACPMYTYRQ